MFLNQQALSLPFYTKRSSLDLYIQTYRELTFGLRTLRREASSLRSLTEIVINNGSFRLQISRYFRSTPGRLSGAVQEATEVAQVKLR